MRTGVGTGTESPSGVGVLVLALSAAVLVGSIGAVLVVSPVAAQDGSGGNTATLDASFADEQVEAGNSTTLHINSTSRPNDTLVVASDDLSQSELGTLLPNSSPSGSGNVSLQIGAGNDTFDVTVPDGQSAGTYDFVFGLSETNVTDRAALDVTGKTVDSCEIIDEPGSYRLTSDLQSSDTCITITTSDVSLSGGGNSVSAGGSSGAIAVRDDGSGVENVAIRDVTVQDSGAGVRIGASDETVSDVVVEGVTGIDNSRAGVVSFTATEVSVRNSEFRRNGLGIELLGGSATVEGVTARNSDGAGLDTALDLSRLTVDDSVFTDNGGQGLLVREVADGTARIRNVTANGNGVDGIAIRSSAPGATLAEITASGNDRHGVLLGSRDTTVVGAMANDNTESGFVLPALAGATDGRELRPGDGEIGLEASGNGQAGAQLSGSDTTVVGLQADDNRDGIDLTDATGVTVTDATPGDGDRGVGARSNTRYGVVLSNTTDSAVNETLVQGNGVTGIHAVSSERNLLADLTVNDNALTFNTTAGGPTTVERMAIQSADVSFEASDVRFNSTTPPGERARPGNRTFATYLDIETTGTGSGGLLTDGGEGSGYIDLTVAYPADAVSDPPLVESTARIHSHDGSSWSEVAGSSNDADAGTVSANITDPAATYAPAADLENAITSCGFNDWSSGETYRIDADLNSISGACLEVRASDSRLVGFGPGGVQSRTLTGDGGTEELGIDVRPGRSNVTVENLSVREFGTAVRLGSGPTGSQANHTVRSVTTSDNAGTGVVVLGDGSTVENTRSATNDGAGLRVESGQDTTLRTLLFFGNTDPGLVLTGETPGATAEDVNLFADGQTTVVGFDGANDVTIAPSANPPDPGVGLKDLSNYTEVNGPAGDSHVNLSVRYSEDNVGAESRLSLYDYNEATDEYEAVPGSETGDGADVVYANLTSFSTFAVLEDTSNGGATPTPTPEEGATPTPTPEDGATPTPTPEDGATPTPTPDGGDGGDGGGGGSDGDGSGGGGSPSSGIGGGGGGGGGATAQSSPNFATIETNLNRTGMRVGGAVAIDATVRNTGDGAGTYEVELVRNGDFVRSRFVELFPDEEETITFERTPPSTGNYTFRVENVTAGMVTVVGADEPTPTPTATPDGGDATDGTPTGDGDGTGSDGGGGSDGASGDDGANSLDGGGGTSAPSSPGDPSGGIGGLGPLGMMAGGVGALAVGAGVIYLLVLRP
jgi:hypothetical protein